VIDEGSIYLDDNPWYPESLSGQIGDHAEIQISMMGRNPLPVYNGFRAKSLRIKSKSTGSGSTVSFDQTSTAFNLIFGNSNETIDFVNKYNRNQKHGYQYKIGGSALSGYAISNYDCGEYTVGASANKYIGSLGKRLGDCSSANKTLTVIIDGTTYNIVFNKNYNGTASTVAPTYTNAQIIAEIVAIIGTVADVDLYNLSGDYYPAFGNMENLKNGDTSEILAGMAVVRTGLKTVRKALNSDNRISGICLDDALNLFLVQADASLPS